MSGHLFDTNIVSSVFRGTLSPALEHRLREMPVERWRISSVTVAEMMQGALALIRKEESAATGTFGHSLLTGLVVHFRDYTIIKYDAEAKSIFRAMPAAVKRNGRADCEIAACAIRHGLVVVTRNLRHFQMIPGVVCEDWTSD